MSHRTVHVATACSASMNPIQGVEGGVQVRGHAYAAATDAHVNAALGERLREIRPQAAPLRAQPTM